MAKYQVDWVENKTNDWKLATLVGDNGARFEEVSINRTTKKGTAFPNFDGIKVGELVEGNLWTSPSGKDFLYPYDREKTAVRAPRGIAAAQERKAQFIEKAQDRKEEGIAYFNSTNSAIQLLSVYQNKSDYPLTEDGMKDFIREWRNWFLNEWQEYDAKDVTDKHKPF